MQFPILIGLCRSRLLDRLLLGLFVLSSLSIFAYPVEIYGRLLLFVLLAAGAIHAWRALQPSVLKIRLERDGSLRVLCRASDDWLRASCAPEMMVHPWLTVLRLQTEDGRRFSLPLTVDSANSEDFRRLRVFLRWQLGTKHPDDAA